NISTGGNGIYDWNFDYTSIGAVIPGISSTISPQNVLFNAPGTYTVQLIAHDASGTTSSALKTINVQPATGGSNFTCSFVASGGTGTNGNTVNLSNLSKSGGVYPYVFLG